MRTSSRSLASWVRPLPAPAHAGGHAGRRAGMLLPGIARSHVRGARLMAGENMTDEEIMEMITAADVDKDGMINEEEFWRIQRKG